MGTRRHQEQGSVTAFVVGVTFALVMCGGLVYDGGRLIEARTEAGDLAENAARAGAQELTSLRAGTWKIDPAKATSRASQYLAEHGAAGSVAASDVSVAVTVRRTTDMTLLGLVGVGSKTVSVTRTAQPVDR
jgi:Flp pilus assembly protein TadG